MKRSELNIDAIVINLYNEIDKVSNIFGDRVFFENRTLDNKLGDDIEDIKPLELNDRLLELSGFEKQPDKDLKRLTGEDSWFYRKETDETILVIAKNPFGNKNKWVCNCKNKLENEGWNTMSFNYIHQVQYFIAIITNEDESIKLLDDLKGYRV